MRYDDEKEPRYDNHPHPELQTLFIQFFSLKIRLFINLNNMCLFFFYYYYSPRFPWAL